MRRRFVDNGLEPIGLGRAAGIVVISQHNTESPPQSSLEEACSNLGYPI